MPELPEVEIVTRGLEQALAAKPKLLEVDFLRRDLRDPFPVKKIRKVIGQRVLSLRRRAKYIILQFENEILISHLGMTGTWRFANKGEEPRDHDHLRLHFEGLTLVYNDPRRFGIFEWSANEESYPRFKGLGPEPFVPHFSAEFLRARLKGKKVAIKVAIMDQKVVVGVGNIYASEALFRAKIKPHRAASRVTAVELEKLVLCIEEVLRESIASGGSTISDFAQTSGESGYFQTRFDVYGREGEPCRHCRNPIRAQVLGGRNTFWCSKCQK